MVDLICGVAIFAGVLVGGTWYLSTDPAEMMHRLGAME